MRTAGDQEARSIGAATAKVVDAAERFLSTRLDLARSEAGRVARGGAVLLAGTLVGVGGWAVLMAALVLALAPIIAPAWVLAALGALHLGAGLAVAAAGLRRLRPEAIVLSVENPAPPGLPPAGPMDPTS